jgi:hypothetical protein
MVKGTDGGLVDARKKLSQALATGLQSGGDLVTATLVWFENSNSAAIVEAVSLSRSMRRLAEQSQQGRQRCGERHRKAL